MTMRRLLSRCIGFTGFKFFELRAAVVGRRHDSTPRLSTGENVSEDLAREFADRIKSMAENRSTLFFLAEEVTVLYKAFSVPWKNYCRYYLIRQETPYNVEGDQAVLLGSLFFVGFARDHGFYVWEIPDGAVWQRTLDGRWEPLKKRSIWAPWTKGQKQRDAVLSGFYDIGDYRVHQVLVELDNAHEPGDKS